MLSLQTLHSCLANKNSQLQLQRQINFKSHLKASKIFKPHLKASKIRPYQGTLTRPQLQLQLPPNFNSQLPFNFNLSSIPLTPSVTTPPLTPHL